MPLLIASAVSGAPRRAHQDRTHLEPPGSLELVVPLGPVRLQAPIHQIGHRHAALAPALAAIDAQRRLGAIKVLDLKPRELSAPQTRAVQQRQHRDPQPPAVLALHQRRGAPQCLHVLAVDPARQPVVGR